jgi:hypothetical protein
MTKPNPLLLLEHVSLAVYCKVEVQECVYRTWLLPLVVTCEELDVHVSQGEERLWSGVTHIIVLI